MIRMLVGSVIMLLTTMHTTSADIEIPFNRQLDFLILKAGINQHDSLNFIFDTGAFQTIIDIKTAEVLELEKTDFLYDRKADQVVDRSQYNRLYMNGTLLLERIDLYMIDLTKLSDIIGKKIDGIIGFDLLNEFAVNINISDEKLILYEDGYNPPSDAHQIPLIIERGKPLITASLDFYNQRNIAGKFLIDSGSAFPVSVYGGGENRPSQDDLPELYEFYSVGLFGNIKEKLGGNLKELSFGGLSFNKVPICMEKEDWDENKNYSGILGAELIKKFNLILDFKEKVSYWQPNYYYDDPFRINKLGIVLRKDEEKEKVYVKYVFEESIAAKFDIKQNDVVLRINGVDLNRLPMTRIYRLMEGKIEQMVLERGNYRKYIHFTPVSR